MSAIIQTIIVALIGQSKHPYTPTKGVLTSKTYQGIIVAAMGSLGPVFGFEMVDAEWAQVVNAILVIVGLLWAGYGRNKATMRIGKAL